MKLPALLATLILFSGCATTETVPERLQQIVSVSVDEDIKMPPYPVLGSLQLTIDDKKLDPYIKKQTGTPLNAILKEQNIDFRRMLLGRAEASRNSINYRLGNKAGGKSANLRLSVNKYGFIKGWGFSAKPFIEIRATLDVDNQVAWSKSYSVEGYSDTLSVPLSLAHTPPYLHRLLTSGIDTVMNDVDADLAKVLHP